MSIVNKTLSIGLKVKNMVADGWENVLTGMGLGADKRGGGRVRYKGLTWIQKEDLHDSDEIAHRVVNLIPDEGVLKWLEHKIPEDAGKKITKKIQDEEDRLSLKDKILLAWKWSRLYGGAGIYVSVDDGQRPDMPLDLKKIRKIKTLTVLHKYQLSAGRLNDNIDDENYGKPEYYSVSGASSDVPFIHHTRLIIIQGAEVSEGRYVRGDYWNDSVLTKLWEVLRDFNMAYAAASNIIQDFNIMILKLKDLADIIGGDDDNLIRERLRLMNLSKSVIGSILLDAENESVENLSTQLSGVDKVLEKIDGRLVTATGMPHTVILGDGATGTLSGKGESEDKIFKGIVAKEQGKVLTKPLDQFYKIMFAQKQGPTNGTEPLNHTWEFCPLFQPSQKEVADTRKVVAETDKIYIECQVLDPLSVSKSRFGGDEYSMETSVDVDALKLQMEIDKTEPDPQE